MKIAFGLVGASGFGSEVMPLVKDSFIKYEEENNSIDYFFIDNNSQKSTLNGIKILYENDFFSMDYDKFFFNVAIADSKIRQKVCERFLKKGCIPFNIHSVFSRILSGNFIGEGSILTDDVKYKETKTIISLV